VLTESKLWTKLSACLHAFTESIDALVYL